MISLVYAPPKTGKSLFLVSVYVLLAFDREKDNMARQVLKSRISEGYPLDEYLKLKHFIFSNNEIIARKFGYYPRVSNIFNPFEFGLPNTIFKTRFFPEYSTLFIDEAQKYFNSRKKLNEYTSRAFETSGHMHYDIWLATQRPKLIDLNVRELITKFIDIRKVEFKETKHGIKTIIYTIEHEDNYSVEKYIESGRKEMYGGIKNEYEINRDLRQDYNAFCYNESFYNGFHDKETKFTYEINKNAEEVIRSDYNVPKGYFEK